MIQFNFDKQCYGCGLCAAVCPTRAIEMQMNREGFSIPVIHEENCIQCEKCDKMCVRINSEHPGIELAQQNIYAYYLLDMQQRIKSTSGGGSTHLQKI